MKKVIDQFVLDSLYEYLNHAILRKLEAFTNKPNENFYLYSPADQTISGKTIYGSSYAQFVYDESIPSAVIPVDNSIDFLRGRLVSNSSLGAGPVQRNVSVKDINIYTTTKSEQGLIFEQKLDSIKRGEYLKPNSIAAPAVFIKNNTSNNSVHCFGGIDNHIYRFKIICLLDTMQQLQGVQYVIREARHIHIPLIRDSIFTIFGNLRNPPFNYLSISENTEEKIMIRDSSFANITDEFGSVNHNKYVGVGNMELRIVF